MRVSPLPSTSIVRTAKVFATLCADAVPDTDDDESQSQGRRQRSGVSASLTFTSGTLRTKLIRAGFIRRLYQLTIIKVVTQDEWPKNQPKQNDKKVTPRSEDFAAWYNDICLRAELADYSPVRGCIVFRPDGFAIWEALRDELDQPHQEDRRAQRVLPAVHPAELPAKGSATRRGVRARARGRHARRRQGARRAADRAADVRDDHQPHVRAVDQIASRFADDGESMVQRRAMGNAHPHVPAHHGVPLAGGTHGARDGRGSAKRDARDARSCIGSSSRSFWRFR